MDGEVLIVDEHTGRTLIGRRYNEGLHQALEAKEGVEIKDEYQTLATITLQNYFRMYNKLAGMTGTAKTEESEFQKIYGLGVLPIATNKPMIRVDQTDLIYRTEAGQVRRDRRGRRCSVTRTVSRCCWVPRRSPSPSCSRKHARAGRRPARGAQRQAARARGGDRRAWPAARAPSPWPPTWRAVAPTSSSAATPSS